MSRTKPQRGPLLSSVVMVMLATAATGLLVIIGFQGLPDTIVPSNFGGGGHETRNVEVSDSPSARPEVRPTAPPASTATAAPPTATRTTAQPRPTFTGGNRPTTQPARPPATTATTAPPKTTKPSPTPTKVSPTPTQTTQAPSPAPSCGNGRKPRCPQSPSAERTPTRTPSSYSPSSGTDDAPAPRYSSSKGGGKPKAAKPTRTAAPKRAK